MSQYFNINMLDDYLELGLKFKVYVNGEYIIVEKKVPNSISEFTKIITSTSLDDLKDIEETASA